MLLMSISMEEHFRPRIVPDEETVAPRTRVEREERRRARQTPLLVSVLFILAGLACGLIAITVLAGWPWALAAACPVLVYAGFVTASRAT